MKIFAKLLTNSSCILGEIVGGPLSDQWQNWRSKRASSGCALPEDRLWLSHIGAVISIIGLTVFLVTISNATGMHFIISPTIGVGIAGFGVQIITTIVITCMSINLGYSLLVLTLTLPVDCSDCHRETKGLALGVGINLIRCGWGFVSNYMIRSV